MMSKVIADGGTVRRSVEGAEIRRTESRVDSRSLLYKARTRYTAKCYADNPRAKLLSSELKELLAKASEDRDTRIHKNEEAEGEIAPLPPAPVLSPPLLKKIVAYLPSPVGQSPYDDDDEVKGVADVDFRQSILSEDQRAEERWRKIELAIEAKSAKGLARALDLHMLHSSPAISTAPLKKRFLRDWYKAAVFRPPQLQRSGRTPSQPFAGNSLRRMHLPGIINRTAVMNTSSDDATGSAMSVGLASSPKQLEKEVGHSLFALIARNLESAYLVRACGEHFSGTLAVGCGCGADRLRKLLPKVHVRKDGEEYSLDSSSSTARSTPTGTGAGQRQTPSSSPVDSHASGSGSVSDFLKQHQDRRRGKVPCLKAMYGSCDFSPTVVHRALLAGHDAQAAELLHVLWKMHDGFCFTRFLFSILAEEKDDRGRNLFHVSALVGGVKTLEMIFTILTTTIQLYHQLALVKRDLKVQGKDDSHSPESQPLMEFNQWLRKSFRRVVDDELEETSSSSQRNPMRSTGLTPEVYSSILLDGMTPRSIAEGIYKALSVPDATGNTPFHYAVTSKGAQGKPDQTIEVLGQLQLIALQTAMLMLGESQRSITQFLSSILHSSAAAPYRGDHSYGPHHLDVLFCGINGPGSTPASEIIERKEVVEDLLAYCVGFLATLHGLKGPQHVTVLHEAVRRAVTNSNSLSKKKTSKSEQSSSGILRSTDKKNVEKGHSSTTSSAFEAFKSSLPPLELSHHDSGNLFAGGSSHDSVDPIIQSLLEPLDTTLETLARMKSPSHISLGGVRSYWWSQEFNWTKIGDELNRRLRRDVVNSKDSTGQTPLWVAASRGNLHVIKYLVQKGAKPNVRTTQGSTPLNIAVRKGFINCAEALVLAGSRVDPGVLELAGMNRKLLTEASNTATGGSDAESVGSVHLTDDDHDSAFERLQRILLENCFPTQTAWGLSGGAAGLLLASVAHMASSAGFVLSSGEVTHSRTLSDQRETRRTRGTEQTFRHRRSFAISTSLSFSSWVFVGCLLYAFILLSITSG